MRAPVIAFVAVSLVFAVMVAPGAELSVAADSAGPPVITGNGYPPLRMYPEQVAAASRLRQALPITANAALLVDLDSGQALYALRLHEPLPPASTVKIMTALVALQRSRLDDKVTISPAAAATGGSRMGLVAGETQTVEQLLYGLLLPSGNDAAVALAEHIGGDQAGFVAPMNETAAQLGLSESHFTNPHGLDDDPAQVVSASDLVTLTAAALAYPAFSGIVGTSAAEVAGRALTNTNLLLDNYPGADGVKTGTTDLAGECLVASATRDGHRLLAVVLGSRDRYADAQALLDYGRAGWQWRTLDLADNALAWEAGSDDRHYRLRAGQTSELFLPAWEWPLAQTVRVLTSTVPLTTTTPVGSLRLTLGEQVLAEVPLTVWQGP